MSRLPYWAIVEYLGTPLPGGEMMRARNGLDVSSHFVGFFAEQALLKSAVLPLVLDAKKQGRVNIEVRCYLDGAMTSRESVS